MALLIERKKFLKKRRDSNDGDKRRKRKSDGSSFRQKLWEFQLDEHVDALVAAGIRSLDQILESDGVEQQLIRILDERNARIMHFNLLNSWIQDQRKKTAPRNSPASHFYGFMDCLNSEETDGVPAATVLQIVIHPTVDQEITKMRIPPGAIDTQIRASVTEPRPIISFVGPTGGGKSFFASSFMSRTTPRVHWPVVASPDQAVPTSADVCVARGYIQPDSKEATPVVLLDFEGEGGRLPKNYTRLLQQVSNFFSVDDQKVIKQRQYVVKNVLPSLAYLLSDVLVFTDTLEPRNQERADRIKEFAKVAHETVSSVAWMPALILVQNKWLRQTEQARFDVTSEYDWLVQDLGTVFSSVTVIRVPGSSDVHNLENGLHALHCAIAREAGKVRDVRKQRDCLFTERQFWFSFRSMVKQLDSRGVGMQIVAKDFISNNPTQNAPRALGCNGTKQPPTSPEDFVSELTALLDRYAYRLAGEVKASGMGDPNLDAVYRDILKACLPQEPCCAVLTHGNERYPCSQQRLGHEGFHRNPANLPVQARNLLKRYISFGLWKDWTPCVWAGNFEGSQLPSLDYFQARFNEYKGLPVDQYERALNNSKHDSELEMCPLCMRTDSDLIMLQCLHSLCEECITTRRAIAASQSHICCPFCHTQVDSSVPADESGFRILSLDGGGVRGLIHLLVFKKLEPYFAPWHLADLFDLIIGTSAGGIVALALAQRIPFDTVQEFIDNMAGQILDSGTSEFVRNFRLLSGYPTCDSSALQDALVKLFGPDMTVQGLRPHTCVTTYCTTVDETMTVGSPTPTNYLSVSKHTKIWKAAYATAAAPTFFEPVSLSFAETKREMVEVVDGGIQGNCPAEIGVQLARDVQLKDHNCVEMIASLGTGLEAEKLAIQDGNFFDWAKKLAGLATSSDAIWDRVMVNDAIAGVPKIRINPPGLGSLDGFKRASIPLVQQGMNEYFSSPRGKRDMLELIHTLHAKQWVVNLTSAFVVGEPKKLSISLRESAVKAFPSLDESQQQYFIRNRLSNSPTYANEHELRELTERAFRTNPFPLIKGSFAVTFEGKVLLPDENRQFTIVPSQPGRSVFNVEWRAEGANPPFKVSIAGFSRNAFVLENKPNSK